MFLVIGSDVDWVGIGRNVAIVLAIYLIAIWLTLVFWTYRDIRSRTRDTILQTVAVMLVLVLAFPGHWIYLIVRPRQTLTELYERSLEEEALLQDLEDQKSCPTCRRRVRDEFLICPSCRTQLKETCRACAKPLSYAWVACPYCGVEKPPREHLGARPVRPPQRPSMEPAPAPQQRPQVAATAPQRVTRPSRDPFATRPQARAAGEDATVIGE